MSRQPNPSQDGGSNSGRAGGGGGTSPGQNNHPGQAQLRLSEARRVAGGKRFKKIGACALCADRREVVGIDNEPDAFHTLAFDLSRCGVPGEQIKWPVFEGYLHFSISSLQDREVCAVQSRRNCNAFRIEGRPDLRAGARAGAGPVSRSVIYEVIERESSLVH